MKIQITLATKYRIVKTQRGNFGIEYRYWFWPVWIDSDEPYRPTIEMARETLDSLKGAGTVVYEE